MLWDGVLFLKADAPTPPQRFLARGRSNKQNKVVVHLRGALNSSRAYPSVSDSLSLGGLTISHGNGSRSAAHLAIIIRMGEHHSRFKCH